MIPTDFNELQGHELDVKTQQKYDSSQQKEQIHHQNQYLNSVKRKHFFSNAKQLLSPLQNDIVEFKDFSTPNIADFSQNKRQLRDDNNQNYQTQTSPLMRIQLNRDNKCIKKIAQKQNQQSEDGQMQQNDDGQMMEYYQESHYIEMEQVKFDILGNKICEFVVSNNLDDDEDEELEPILEDKENDVPYKYSNMNTPLKIRPPEARSPLQDITPSMTHKKKEDSMKTKTNKKNKTSNKTSNKGLGFEFQKWGLLTPRTMAQSRMNKAKNSNLSKSTLKVERF